MKAKELIATGCRWAHRLNYSFTSSILASHPSRRRINSYQPFFCSKVSWKDYMVMWKIWTLSRVTFPSLLGTIKAFDLLKCHQKTADIYAKLTVFEKCQLCICPIYRVGTQLKPSVASRESLSINSHRRQHNHKLQKRCSLFSVGLASKRLNLNVCSYWLPLFSYLIFVAVTRAY